ncbi:MAG: cell division protein FtsA [Rickettsiaceae bacterium]|nr:cell division protein FtsA [Rickettsiaceae bacterium]
MKARFANSVTLDLGSSKIAAIAAFIENNGEARILCQHMSHSEGLKSGTIVDLKQAENSIINAIYSLEKNSDKSIKDVAISLSGAGTKSYYIYNTINLHPKTPVTKKDVKRLIEKSLSEFKLEDQDIIHYFPIEFTLDDYNSLDDPIGMLGRELSCKMHIVAAQSNMLLNISNCLSRCQVDISNIMLAIYADGMACLTEDEQNLGAIILDIGARTTSFGVFLGKKLIYSGYIPVGGWHITSDIAKAFSIKLEAAEKIKVLYGSASCGLATDNMINLEDFDPTSSENLDNTTITTLELADIIAPRTEEILNLVKDEYDKIAIDHLIGRRMILTGGSAMLHGMKELASKIFGRQTRIGRPITIPGFAEECNPCVYSSSLGMVKINALAKQKNFYLSAKQNDEDGGIFSRMIRWLRDNI